MRRDRQALIQQREAELIRSFPALVAAFAGNPPFDRAGQFEHHRDTIALRRAAGSAVAALQTPEFMKLLYATLRAWGIGLRASRLVPFPVFEKKLRAQETRIANLENAAIDDADPGLERARLLWEVLDNLAITDNQARLVPSTKALHHVLPDLVVPMDRAYTQDFFGWHNPEFQGQQAACFQEAFKLFCRVARKVNPGQFVGSGWNSSKAKVIDNAIVGFVRAAQEASDRDVVPMGAGGRVAARAAVERTEETERAHAALGGRAVNFGEAGTTRQSGASSDSLDAMTAAPAHHKVLLENDTVRVLDSWVAPGETTPVHEHRWPGVLYVLSWSDFIRYDRDGTVLLDSRTLPVVPEAGGALWSPPLGPHFVLNVGGRALHVIAMELKTPAAEGEYIEGGVGPTSRTSREPE